MTHEQAEMLTEIERRHGDLRRIRDDSCLGGDLLAQFVSDTYAFQCRCCGVVFTVEPDGNTEIWAP